jgi:hypothetical protein
MTLWKRLFVEDIEDSFTEPAFVQSFQQVRFGHDVTATDVDEYGACLISSFSIKLFNYLKY